MKLKSNLSESSKKEPVAIRKYSTADAALKAKHDLARDFFKKINLPK